MCSFLTLYDGNTANGAQLAQLSGAKNDLQTTRFTATGPAMFLQFTSDESLTAGGFAFSYTCGAAPPPPARPPPPPTPTRPPAPPPPGVAPPTPISPNGQPVQGNIQSAGQHVWYSFAAQSQGQEFQIEVQLGTLEDSVVDVIDVDRETVLVENDDDERSGASTLGSYVEWTAPAAGTYFIMVKPYETETGTFTVTLTGSSGQAGDAHDPCTQPLTLQGSGVISHMPNGNYQDSRTCDWQVSCAAGQTASFTFTELDTELDYDFVTLYDGTSGSRQIDQVSGNLVDMATTEYRSTGATLTLEFSSDDSIGARGFEGNYRCQSGGGGGGGGGGAPPPPPQATGEATNEFDLIQT